MVELDNDKSDDDDKKQQEHLQYNLDADSDFSIDSDDSDDGDEAKKVKTIENVTSNVESGIKIEKIDVDPNIVKIEKNDQILSKQKEDELKMPPPLPEPLVEITISEPILPPKVKIDKWKKRTVGDLFDAAVKRYFERKSLRSAS